MLYTTHTTKALFVLEWRPRFFEYNECIWKSYWKGILPVREKAFLFVYTAAIYNSYNEGALSVGMEAVLFSV